MKKSIFKKVIALVLVMTMLATLTVTAFAKDEVVPVIVISGMNSTVLYDAQTGESVFPPTQTSIDDVLTDTKNNIVNAVKNWDSSIFTKGLTDELYKMFKNVSCDSDGVPVHDVTTAKFNESIDNYDSYFSKLTLYQQSVARSVGKQIGGENTYFFNYDWRLSPLDHADDLNEMVEKVKTEHNCDKVNLVSLSMGGTVMSSYVYKYGTDSIGSMTYGSTAFLGVDLAGMIMSGEVEVTSTGTLDFVANFIKDSLVASSAVSFTSSLIGATYLTEKAIDKALKLALSELSSPLYNDVLIRTFIPMLGMWALIPQGYYEESKEFVSTIGGLSDEFFAKTDEYMYNVQAKVPEMIEEARENGVDVYIIGSYGYTGVPLTPATHCQADLLIETKYMTGNCMVADYNKTLDDVSYESQTVCNNPEHNHISTDNIVDSSVGLLPEHTWVINDMSHIEFEYGTPCCDLITWLATTNESVDVYSNENYPQFLQYDRMGRVFTSLTEGVEIKNEPNHSVVTFASRMVELLVTLFDFLSEMLNVR